MKVTLLKLYPHYVLNQSKTFRGSIDIKQVTREKRTNQTNPNKEVKLAYSGLFDSRESNDTM